jgi:hypothetical protein
MPMLVALVPDNSEPYILWIGVVTAGIAIAALFASKRQNELKTVPSLSFQVRDTDGNALSGKKFYLIRHTKQLIWQVKIRSIYDLDETNGRVSKYSLAPTLPDNYWPEDASIGRSMVRIEKWPKINDEYEPREGTRELLLSFGDAIIIVTFRDFQRIKYIGRFRLDHGRAKLIHPPLRVLGIANILYWAPGSYSTQTIRITRLLAKAFMIRTRRLFEKKRR